MRIAKIKVSPFVYAVRWDKDLNKIADISGLCNNAEVTILMDPTFPIQYQRDTILHESMHAIWTQTSLDNIYTDEQEEQVIWALAPRLLSLLRDNPKLTTFLLEAE